MDEGLTQNLPPLL